MSDTVRSERKSGFYWLDNALYEEHARRIGVYGLAVYNALAYYADSGGRCFPGMATIAEHLDCSERKVRDTLRELEGVGLISITPNFDSDGRQTSNIYTLHHMQGGLAPHAGKQESVNKNQEAVITSLSGRLKAVTTAYEQYIGPIVPLIYQDLVSACRVYPTAWLVESFELTQQRYVEGKCSKPSFAYALGICANWKANGYDGKLGAASAEDVVDKEFRRLGLNL